MVTDDMYKTIDEISGLICKPSLEKINELIPVMVEDEEMQGVIQFNVLMNISLSFLNTFFISGFNTISNDKEKSRVKDHVRNEICRTWKSAFGEEFIQEEKEKSVIIQTV